MEFLRNISIPRKKSALRSPYRSSDGYAYRVGPNGDVDYYYGDPHVTNPFGRSSPELDVGDGNACLVQPGGSVIVSGWDVEYSYGNIYSKKILTFVLRAPSMATFSSLRTVYTKTATLASTVTLSRIPTGIIVILSGPRQSRL